MKRALTLLITFLLVSTAASLPAWAAPPPPAARVAAAQDVGDASTVYYKIVNRASNRLLSVDGGGTANGDVNIIYDDVAASDQLWIIQDADQGYHKLINKRSGRALSTLDGSTSNGTVTHLWQYLGNAQDQDWTISTSNPGYVKIGNRKRSEAALSVVDAGTDNNDRTQVWDYVDHPDQDWKIVPVQTFDPNASYQIINRNSKTALSVFSGGTSNNNPVDIYEFINQPDQFWGIVGIGGGYYHLINRKSGRLLSLTGGATSNGTIAMVYDDVGASDQAWSIQAQPDGYYSLANQRRPSGLLSIVGAETGRESRAQIFDNVGAQDQGWQLKPVGNSVSVNALNVQANVSAQMTGVGMEDVNHEIYGGIYSQLIYNEGFQEAPDGTGVSKMWGGESTGSASGSFSIDTSQPFQGQQSQHIQYTGGSGRLGVENRGLNRWGINFTADKPYEGYVYLRSAQSSQVYVTAESSSGAVYAETSFTANSSGWTKYPFSFTPNTNDANGQVAFSLKAPGDVSLGFAFLQPGTWGRYAGQPVRKDIADAMITQGVSVLRYGGSATLAEGYRWKNMIGPREFRPVLTGGTWSNKNDSNGWGIIEFLNYAEALGVKAVPTMNIDESPQDMADFIDYLKAPTTTTWGAKRAADGHPAPYGVDQLELGNERLIDSTYADKFNAIAAQIWAKDPTMTLTVGDMGYHDVIANPDHVTGSESGITSLAAYQSILDFAGSHNGKISIDVHTWTDTPEQVAHEVDAIVSLDTWIHRYNPGVDCPIDVFELNAYHHDVSRALGNAVAISLLQQQGNRVRIVTSANALQPDGQNDDGWDQGLVFFDTKRSWLQPPGYVTQMMAQNYVSTVVNTMSSNPAVTVTAKLSGSVMTLEVTNSSDQAQTPDIALTGYLPSSLTAQVTQLAGGRGQTNSANDVNQVVPQQTSQEVTLSGNVMRHTFPANSFTILRLQ